MKWYSILDNGTSDNITLLLDHNTTATVAWASSGTNTNGPITAFKQLESDTASWNSTIKNTARLIEAREIATITGNSGLTAGGSYYYFHTNSTTKYTGAAGTNKYAWLFDNTYNCTTYGCNVAASGTWGYWTNTAVSSVSATAFYVFCDGKMNNLNVSHAGNYGVRPVVTISKSIIS